MNPKCKFNLIHKETFFHIYVGLECLMYKLTSIWEAIKSCLLMAQCCNFQYSAISISPSWFNFMVKPSLMQSPWLLKLNFIRQFEDLPWNTAEASFLESCFKKGRSKSDLVGRRSLAAPVMRLYMAQPLFLEQAEHYEVGKPSGEWDKKHIRWWHQYDQYESNRTTSSYSPSIVVATGSWILSRRFSVLIQYKDVYMWRSAKTQPAGLGTACSRCDWLSQLTVVRSHKADRSLLCRFWRPQAEITEPDDTSWLKYDWISALIVT